MCYSHYGSVDFLLIPPPSLLVHLVVECPHMAINSNKQRIEMHDNPMTSKMLGWDRHSNMAQFAFLLVLCESFETNTAC